MPSQPTLVLHFGVRKTGSSAIQGFLRNSHAALRRHGVTSLAYHDPMGGSGLVPQTARPSSANASGAVGRYQRADTEQRTAIARDWVSTIERIGSDARVVVVSAESFGDHLARDPTTDSLLRTLREAFPLRAVAYLRPQDTAVVSGYGQWGFRSPLPASRFLTNEITNPLMNYAQWIGRVRRETDVDVRIRPYVRSMLRDQDVIADFVATADLGVPDETVSTYVSPPVDRNESWSFDALPVLRAGKGILWRNEHDNRKLNALKRLLPEMLGRADPDSAISRWATAACYTKFAEGNRALWAEEGMPDLHGFLDEPEWIEESLDDLWRDALAELEPDLDPGTVRFALAAADALVAAERARKPGGPRPATATRMTRARSRVSRWRRRGR